ncbi:DUF3997 domain-containing protein [Rhodocytophaga rosea]|uniref:DUF3997 domain-containing protein n=1 Tax=Rhodocytophaga rosea TaxID=2704465 RepID=A0A6C0GT97_9BACT|nr:DUF3997 domain-containing protein [Rhodocytophaga rosea]QHT71246.1 DUF3997 domain-containing protein [Rhodocytophaga rosea]
MNHFYKVLSLFLLILLTSCFGSYKNEKIIGPYSIIALDIPTDMCIIHNEKEDYSGGSVVVSNTVFEVEWNNNFIVAKQHPNSYVLKSLLKNQPKELIDSYLTKNKNEITFYYLIDVKANSLFPTLFFTPQQLELAKKELNVGNFQNKIYYENLDQRD